MRNAPATIFLLCSLLNTPSVSAETIYRWTDESGRVHLSDAVPERYKGSAQRIDSKTFELTDAQRTEAADRAKRERTAQAEEAARKAAQAALPPSAPGAKANKPSNKPTPVVGGNCDEQWRQYRESQECFAPYQRRDGGTRADAFEKCTRCRKPVAEVWACEMVGVLYTETADSSIGRLMPLISKARRSST